MIIIIINCEGCGGVEKQNLRDACSVFSAQMWYVVGFSFHSVKTIKNVYKVVLLFNFYL